MKNLIKSLILTSISSMALAGPIGIGFSTNNTNVNNIAQCKEMDESKVNMLSQINMQKEICIYENYAKITSKWTENPPEPYTPPNSIIINLNKKEVSPEMKEKLKKTGEQCMDVAAKMREKLKQMYGVENYSCR